MTLEQKKLDTQNLGSSIFCSVVLTFLLYYKIELHFTTTNYGRKWSKVEGNGTYSVLNRYKKEDMTPPYFLIFYHM